MASTRNIEEMGCALGVRVLVLAASLDGSLRVSLCVAGLILASSACALEDHSIHGWKDVEAIALDRDEVGYVEYVDLRADLTGDGVADLLLGSPGTIAATGGTASIFDPTTGAIGFRSVWWERGGSYGKSLAVGGDRDRDALVDFAILAQPIDQRSFIEVRSGEREEPIGVLETADPCRQFGAVVLDVDANGDGVADVFAIEYSLESPCPDEPSMVRMYDGMTLEPVASHPLETNGYAAIESTPDQDGDGRRDLLVAVPMADDNRGEVRLLSSLDGAVLRRFGASEPEDYYGTVFSACDGDDDILGFSLRDAFTSYPEVSGTIDRLGTDGNASHLIDGVWVVCAPDMNEDGMSDALVLTYDFRWVAVSGRSGARLGEILPGESDALTLAVGGDIDGDGRADIAAVSTRPELRLLLVRSSGR